MGQSIDIEYRWKIYSYKYSHGHKGQVRLSRSFKKYGVEAHIFSVLEECLKEDLNKKERFWQDHYEVLGEKGLNCLLQPHDGQSGRLSEETKLKMSIAAKGKIKSEEHRKNMAESRRGKPSKKKGVPCSEETKAKMRISSSFIGKEPWNKGMKGQYTLSWSEEKKGKPSPKRGVKTGKPAWNSRTIIDITTGEIFLSIKEAAEKYKLKPATLGLQLKGKHPNKTNLRYNN